MSDALPPFDASAPTARDADFDARVRTMLRAEFNVDDNVPFPPAFAERVVRQHHARRQELARVSRALGAVGVGVCALAAGAGIAVLTTSFTIASLAATARTLALLLPNSHAPAAAVVTLVALWWSGREQTQPRAHASYPLA